VEHNILIILAGLLVLGIVCQWVAWRLKVPAILPLLITGFLIGPIFDWVEPRELLGELFFPMISLLVAVILFEGALTLNLREARAVVGTVGRLITIGALITWIGGTLAAHYVLGLGWSLSVLFGALIMVTGPTVIAPLLRNVRPNHRISSILMWEGILIDPIGALMALLVFDYIVAGGSGHSSNPLLGFVIIVAVGTSAGLAGGVLIAQMLRRYLVPDYLRDVVVLGVVAAVFAISDVLQTESGLLAVTVMGMFLANSNLPQLKAIWHFKEKLSVLFISGLFILLAANVELSTLAILDWRSFVVLAIVIFVLRPISMQISAIGSDLNRNERLFLSWIAPRGIVAAAVTTLFTFRLNELGYTEARILEPLIFLIIVGTVVLQGISAKPFARFLGVAEAEPQGFLLMGAHNFARMLAQAIQKEGFVVRLIDTNADNVEIARREGLSVDQGNILSEYSEEHLDLSGIGRLLALTSNDEANGLACRHHQDEFGSSEVYQLVPRTLVGDSKSVSPSRQALGRLLFTEQATFSNLYRMSHADGKIERMPLTADFTFAEYTERHGTHFIPLLAFKGKSVIVATLDDSFLPQPGWTLLSLVEEPLASQPQQEEPEIEEVETKSVARAIGR
jgi:NhaP-type Na+/H+ or K+/H+ antiporter